MASSSRRQTDDCTVKHLNIRHSLQKIQQDQTHHISLHHTILISRESLHESATTKEIVYITLFPLVPLHRHQQGSVYLESKTYQNQI